jgi:hypothetical protein
MEQHWLAPFIRTGKATDKDHFIIKSLKEEK